METLFIWLLVTAPFAALPMAYAFWPRSKPKKTVLLPPPRKQPFEACNEVRPRDRDLPSTNPNRMAVKAPNKRRIPITDQKEKRTNVPVQTPKRERDRSLDTSSLVSSAAGFAAGVALGSVLSSDSSNSNSSSSDSFSAGGGDFGGGGSSSDF